MGAELLLGLGSGAVSTVNPCGFAMLPAFVAYFLGVREREELSVLNRLARAVGVAGLVTVGFVVTFGVIGAAIAAGSQQVIRWVPWISLAAGVVILGVGVWILSGRSASFGLHAVRNVQGRTARSMVTYGVGYGLASLGCTLPVFLIVVAGALRADGFLPGLAVFLAYALGMGAVLLGVTLATALAKESLVRFLKRAMRHVHVVSGVALIVAGAYLVFNEVRFLAIRGF